MIIIGKSTDYWPFESHPNATLIKISQITKPEEAERYADILQAIVEEMNRRDEILTASHQSTWTRAGRSKTYIALDEYGNALRFLFKKANIVNMWVESLVAEGGKNGLNILIANQRATGMAGVLSQMGKAIFRVEADEEKHHRSLVGASSLRSGYFMAKFGVPEMAGAFDPSDQELIQFLSSRPVKPLEPENWIDGTLIQPKQIEEKEMPFIVPSDMVEMEKIHREGIAKRDDEIVERYEAKQTLAQIQREVFGDSTTGGNNFQKIKKAIAAHYDKQATTAQKAPETPDLGVVVS